MSPISKSAADVSERSYIILKFYDDVEIPYDDQVQRYLQTQDIPVWQNLLETHADISISRLFSTLKPEEIISLMASAEDVDDRYDPSNLLTFFKISPVYSNSREELLEKLRDWDLVEYCYSVSKPKLPAPCTGHNDPRFKNQGYLKKAPAGIDAEFAWNYPGGCGKGVQFIDVEFGWKLDHEDIKAAKIKLIQGINKSSLPHGTSVLGIVAGVGDNKLGGIGIAPAGNTRVVSIYNTATTFNTADAILKAISNLIFGDVLLLELQTADYKPIEIEPAVFEVIRLGSALGLTIVEPAGNGYASTWPHDLDKLTNAFGKQVINPTSKDFKDSGAVVVAGVKSFKVPHEPSKKGKGDGINTGARVDCYAWGDSIDTCSTDTKGTKSTYVSNFGGTSGASAIIAGAAVIVQGMALANLKYRFSGWQMRTILSDPKNGTAPASPSFGSFGLGIMPDLKKIISQKVLNLAPDIYIRDFVGDTGDPHKGAVNASPDIIVRPTKVKDPTKSFGEKSKTENSNLLGNEAVAKKDNYLYVRVRNRGGTDASNVEATLYWSPVATLLTSSLWTRIDPSKSASVADVIIKKVPVGNILTVTEAITWKSANIPGPGHYCFVGLVGNELDPAPHPAAFKNWTNYLRFVRENNNVSWRNFNVVKTPPKPPDKHTPLPGPRYVELPFLVAGAEDHTRFFQWRVTAHLPRGSQLWLEGDDHYFLHTILQVGRYVRPSRSDPRYLRLHTNHETLIGEGHLPAGSLYSMKLHVYIPKKWHHHDYVIFVSQLYLDEEIQPNAWEEVGRVTWILTAPEEQIS